MEQKLNMDRLNEEIRNFCTARDWDQFHSAKDLAIGLVTEGSELLEVFRFLSAAQEDKIMKDAQGRERIGQELADVTFFLLRFSDRFGFNLVEELKKKMALNSQKYPASEFKGKNHKYNGSEI